MLLFSQDRQVFDQHDRVERQQHRQPEGRPSRPHPTQGSPGSVSEAAAEDGLRDRPQSHDPWKRCHGIDHIRLSKSSILFSSCPLWNSN